MTADGLTDPLRNACCSDAHQACETAVVNLSVLNREMFSEAEAARLLELPQSTLHYWLEGGERRGRLYKPIVRVEPQGLRSVTWAEFIEAGLLRQYRREQRVPMAELRAFIDVLRERTGIPYPLAHMKPFVADRQLVMEAQDIAGLEAEFCLVAEVRGQLILTPPSEEFVHRVTWDEQLPVAWRPHSDPRSPVGSTRRFASGVQWSRASAPRCSGSTWKKARALTRLRPPLNSTLPTSAGPPRMRCPAARRDGP